jgi:predicted dehydrogenase
MNDQGLLRLATLGLGNWAGRMVDLLLTLQGKSIDLISVCEPELDHHLPKMNALESRGVRVVRSLDAVLNDSRVEAVFLPVPIHLHRPLTEKCLAAGKAVLVEKPAAGCVQDVDAMILARDESKLPALVSFQDTSDPTILSLKKEILSGAIGKIRSVDIVGCWPRDEMYYRRTTWAGKIQFENTWVLDSPLMNAFAHYLHLALFLLGERESTWAQPTSVEAELYRVYDIENYDTSSQRFIAAGVPVLVLLTHACRRSVGPLIQLHGTKGSVRIDLGGRHVTIDAEGTSGMLRLSPDSRVDAIRAFADCVRGRRPVSAVSTLEAARAHVLATNGASQAALVRQLPESAVQSYLSPDEERGILIPGIEEVMIQCAERQQLLHESGLVKWSAPAGRMSLVDYNRFEGCPSASTFVTKPAKPARAEDAVGT